MDQSFLHEISHNLTAPMPLFFVLGLFATLVRSDLKVPEALYVGLTLYLLAAIGLKGGAEIREVGLAAIWMPLLGTVFLGILLPIIGYVILRNLRRFSIHDAAAIAGHYCRRDTVSVELAGAAGRLCLRVSHYLGADRCRGRHLSGKNGAADGGAE